MSIRNEILARMTIALTGTLPDATPVYRSREVAFARGDVPAVVVMPSDEDTQALSDLMEVSHLNVRIEIIVRGDVWDSLADPIIVAAHGILLADAPLAALCAKLRRTSAKWEGHDADQTAGVLTQTYRLQYLTQTNQL
jgi:hypothetical protein